MNYILRDIKLNKLTGIPLSGEVSKLIKFWDGLWRDMEVHIDIDKGEIKCWKGKCDYYFIQGDKNDNLWCNYNEVWTFFKYDLVLDLDDIQELIQYMVNETLNCRVNKPMGEGWCQNN